MCITATHITIKRSWLDEEFLEKRSIFGGISREGKNFFDGAPWATGPGLRLTFFIYIMFDKVFFVFACMLIVNKIYISFEKKK
jgi:hypothetical protein